MRVHVIIDETGFFLPAYLEFVATHLPPGVEIVGVSVLYNPPDIPTLYAHVKSHVLDIGPASCVRLGFRVIGQLLRNLRHDIGGGGLPGSVWRVAVRRGLRRRRTTRVNGDESLAWIRAGSPDLILSSCSQIFHRPLLAIPTRGAVNRHSALLPAYGGLFPLFQALIHGEARLGSTIHTMTEEIDRGNLVAQSSFELAPEMSLYDCYERSYGDCGPLTIEALEKIVAAGETPIDRADFGVTPQDEASYFSFPTADDWRRFRATGRRFC